MNDVDINSLAWLKTKDGEEWLKHASLGQLVGRQAFLRFHAPETPAADEQYDLIEAAIRGENPDADEQYDTIAGLSASVGGKTRVS